MKLAAELNRHNYQIEFAREGERVVAEIDGRRHKVTVRGGPLGVYILIRDGRVYVCRVERTPDSTETLKVHVGNHAYTLALFDPRRLRSKHGASIHTGKGAAEINSPMAGKVVRILVEHGKQVKAGDGIVVVEAMKMQNELKCPRDGVVSEIRTEAGAAVNAGDVLAIIE